MPKSKSKPSADEARLKLATEIQDRLEKNIVERASIDALARRFGTPLFSNDDISDLAVLLDVDPSRFNPHRAELEYIAHAYLASTVLPSRREKGKKLRDALASAEALDRRGAKKLRGMLSALLFACRQLADGMGSARQHSQMILDMLDIGSAEAAEDGPGPAAERIKLALEPAIEEEALRRALCSVARLADTSRPAVEGIDAATQQVLAQLAKAVELALVYLVAPSQKEIDKADAADSIDAAPHLRLAIRGTLRGNHGPGLPLEAFAGGLLRIYELIVGKQAKIYWSDYTGTLSGKCISFVQRALKPLGATISPNELAGIVKVGKQSRLRNKRN
jgi:hypothetical protein